MERLEEILAEIPAEIHTKISSEIPPGIPQRFFSEIPAGYPPSALLRISLRGTEIGEFLPTSSDFIMTALEIVYHTSY